MNRRFKPRLDILDDRMMPAILGLSSTEVNSPPPPAGTADTLVSQSDEPQAATVHIVCADHVVKGERPKK